VLHATSHLEDMDIKGAIAREGVSALVAFGVHWAKTKLARCVIAPRKYFCEIWVII